MKFSFLLLLVAGAARAADLPCGPAEKGAVSVDGLGDDWSDVEGLDAGGRDANASFTVKCNVDASSLYLFVDVRDNYFVRTDKARPGEDHLQLVLGSKKLIVFPGDAAKIKEKVVWAGKGLRSASVLQEHGWSVELSVPLAEIPGYKRGAPALPFSAAFADCDSKAALTTERTVEESGQIVFAEADAALDAFLKDRGLTRAAIWWDQPMSLGKRSGARALLAGRFLVVLSDQYLYLEAPFRDRKDVRDLRLVDLAGDGRDAIVMRYVERGGAGAREVLAVFRPVGESQIQRVFACEVAKSAGAARVEDKVAFVKRGKATDITVDAGAANGFTAETYREAPAEDMIPILLPWGDDKHARYQFAGDEYRRAQ
jgi:hypothetical protein